MAIRVLDQHTAELIAAGEVVERPASVAKELIENSIDAGAKNISVEIERGGTLLLCVQDDGQGIPAEEIATAFLRHATSKVRTEEDLENITTLGFRGEALASIASVAQVEVLTRTEQDEFACLYRINAGVEQNIEPAARPVGTTMRVQNLFYNTPARMKFLKKDTSEGTFITETITRLALSHPEIAFKYIRDSKHIFNTAGDGKLQSAAYAVLGASFARGLAEVEGEEKQYSAYGLITSPLEARGSRSMQFFFVNERFVKNRTMMAALEQAYRGTVMQGKFPGCVLFLSMPAELVDVNVHPAKTEVRFARESDVFDAVYKAVKSTLLKHMQNHKQIVFDKKEKDFAKTKADFPPKSIVNEISIDALNPSINSEKPATNSYSYLAEGLASTQTYTPYETANLQATTPHNSTLNKKEYLLDIMPETDNEMPIDPYVKENAPQMVFLEDEAHTPLQSLHFIGELFKTYILAQAGDCLCIIDKHAAHERILYEQIAANRGLANSQQLLVPISVVLSAVEKNALMQNLPAIEDAGIEAEDFGGNEVLIRGVPADVEQNSVQNFVEEVAARMMLNSKDTLNEKTEWVLHSIACRAAVKAGDKTAPQQLLKLAKEILQGTIPPFCPHGRPVVLEITRKELEKQFGRLG